MTHRIIKAFGVAILTFVSGGLADEAAAAVLCAQEVGEALRPCTAEVERDGGAVVVIMRFPNGFQRRLMFEDGLFLRGNSTMSGVGTDMEWSLLDGVYRIRVDDQRFEFPQALVDGD